MSLVTVRLTEQLSLRAIVIETPDTAPYLVHGRKIQLMFKETEVVIGTREDLPVSLQNSIKGLLQSVETGTLLSRLQIETEVGPISSVISSNSVERLGLRENSEVYAMVKLNEMMLSE